MKPLALQRLSKWRFMCCDILRSNVFAGGLGGVAAEGWLSTGLRSHAELKELPSASLKCFKNKSKQKERERKTIRIGEK